MANDCIPTGKNEPLPRAGFCHMMDGGKIDTLVSLSEMTSKRIPTVIYLTVLSNLVLCPTLGQTHHNLNPAM
jgi:hypothetical protein